MNRIFDFINKHADKLFCGLLLLFILLRLIKAYSYITSGTDEAVFIHMAKSIMEKGFVFSTTVSSNLYGFSKYTFHYPPLHPMLLATMFKISGISYESAKAIPILFSICNIIIVYIFCKKYISATVALFTSIMLGFDPMYYNYSVFARPEATIMFFYTLSAIFFYTAETKNISKMYFSSGLLAGFAVVTSLNAFWLILAFAVYQIATNKIFKNWIRGLVYLSGFIIVASPWYLWIFLNEERRSAFIEQVFLHSAFRTNFDFALLVRNLLNPLADLYLITFRNFSIYPFILLIALIFLIFNFRKYKYLFFVLLIPLFMVTIMERKEFYLLITMPICYVSFGYFLDGFQNMDRYFNPAIRKRIILIFILIFLLINSVILGILTFKKPTLIINADYYKTIFETYTKKDSRIATDVALYLSAFEGRKLYSVGLLIWDYYRKFYSYQELVDGVNADYIILTESLKKWSDSDAPQNGAFHKLLEEDFRFTIRTRHPLYTDLWIYEKKK